MIKKFTPFLLLLTILSLVTINNGYGQVKKSSTKKTATTKKAPAKKKPVVKVIDPKDIPGTKVKLTTDSGIVIIRLYDSTPVHRDNFIKLVKQGFYDSLLFHRVIPQFMIQGGDPLSKHAQPGEALGNGGDELGKIMPEFRPYLFHKRGVLAAARDNNPQKASSACQFYIVVGKKFSLNDISMMESQMGRTFTPAEKEAYTTVGGTPWLDQGYTVFGEVESGIETIDKIANMPRDRSDRPLKDISMKMEIVN